MGASAVLLSTQPPPTLMFDNINNENIYAQNSHTAFQFMSFLKTTHRCPTKKKNTEKAEEKKSYFFLSKMDVLKLPTEP